MAAARQVLMMMTGWSLPDDIIDHAARALRVRALLGDSMTSEQLDELLTMYEWAHAQQHEEGPGCRRSTGQSLNNSFAWEKQWRR